MSYQNADDENIRKSETPSKTDRELEELVAAMRAMTLATQDPAPIFQLTVGCWEKIFDWLSFDDLHSFGQTCKFFYQIIGKYFEWKYRSCLSNVYRINNEFNVVWPTARGYLEGFSEFAQRLYVLNTEELLFASQNCKSLSELQFIGLISSGLDMNRLEKMLASFEILTFKYMPLNTNKESILKHCASNLKRLTIDESRGCNDISTGWMHLKYPKLEHLELYAVSSAQELVQFFRENPNVRSFSTDAEDILEEYQSEFMASTIELDDLTVRGATWIDDIPNALIELYNRGFYKRLHFKTLTNNHLADLPGITTLDVYTNDYIDIPHLPSVTRLFFQPLYKDLRSLLNMNNVTDALPNLECVVMRQETNMEYLMPFIRNSKKLKEIKTQFFRNDHNGDIDPVLMNSEREKLNATQKVMIYFEEKDYLRLKWKYNKSDFGLIEVKRHESYDGMLDHSFDGNWD